MEIFYVFLQKFAEAIHHRALVFGERMRVTVERYHGVFVPENFRKRFYVHSAFQRARGEGVPQRMYSPARQAEFFE